MQHVAYEFKMKILIYKIIVFLFYNNSFVNKPIMSSLEGFSNDIHENGFITYQLFFDAMTKQGRLLREKIHRF